MTADARPRKRADQPGKCGCCLTRYRPGEHLVLDQIGNHVALWVLAGHEVKVR